MDPITINAEVAAVKQDWHGSRWHHFVELKPADEQAKSFLHGHLRIAAANFPSTIKNGDKLTITIAPQAAPAPAKVEASADAAATDRAAIGVLENESPAPTSETSVAANAETPNANS